MAKFAFHKVEYVFHALYEAFQADNGNELPDNLLSDAEHEKFRAIFIVFLSMAGWNEEEFFIELENQPDEDICPDCGEPMSDHDDEDLPEQLSSTPPIKNHNIN
jgi:hypothetical protein